MPLEQTVEKLRAVVEDEWCSHDERRIAHDALTALTGAQQVVLDAAAREALIARLTAENAELRAASSSPREPQTPDFRNGCVCNCCDHGESSDCGCNCHAEGRCSFSDPPTLVDRLRAAKHSAMARHGHYPSVIDEAIAALEPREPHAALIAELIGYAEHKYACPKSTTYAQARAHHYEWHDGGDDWHKPECGNDRCEAWSALGENGVAVCTCGLDTCLLALKGA